MYVPQFQQSASHCGSQLWRNTGSASLHAAKKITMLDGFIVKKLLSLFVHIIPGVLILLLAVLLCRRWVPRLSYAISILLVLALIVLSRPPVSNYFVERLEHQYPPLLQAPSDTALILVLGYGHNYAPGRPPNSVLTAGALSRLTEGVRLWRSQPQSMLAVSGAGLNQAISHAQAMKNMALFLDVPEEKITLFEHTRDTANEIRTALEYLDDRALNEPGRLVVVSSATHLPRAALMLEGKNIDHSMAPTDFLAGNASWYGSGSSALYILDRAVHEWVGMLWYKIRQHR